MIEIKHNNINSNYFIINFKLNRHINADDKYIIIIKKWIQNILDKYLIMSNWVIYIKNLNYKYFRIFIYLNSLNYSNMDNENLIYLTDMINYENIFKINIKDFVRFFNTNELELLINLELNIIDSNLDDESSSEENDCTAFDIIDLHFSESSENKQFIKKFISKIGVSGLNKVTFFNELLKLVYIGTPYNNIYSNNQSSNSTFNDIIFTKIKENNKYYWVDYNENEINNKNIILKLLFNY